MASVETPPGWSPPPLKNISVLLYGTLLSSPASSPDDSSISSFPLFFFLLCSLVIAAIIGPKDDALVEQVRLHNPDVVILVETKNKSYRYEYLIKVLRMDCMQPVEPRGIGGGPCVFWKEDARIALVKSYSFFIELGFGDDRDYTDEKGRRDQWRKLGKRISYWAGKSLLIGDFDDIVDDEEKEGPAIRSPRRFFYDSRWGEIQECRDLVLDSWQERIDGSLAFQVSEDSYLKANKKNKSWWGWKGILLGRQLLRVGNGSSIIAANDPWIPKPNSFKPLMKQSATAPQVDFLIDPVTKEWKDDLGAELLESEDAEIIRSSIWHYTSNGICMVRPRYFVAREMMKNGLRQ